MATYKPLKMEYDNAKIIDYRDLSHPNNSIVITCEHASNALPEGYSWTDNDRANFANEHWAWDPASLDVAQYLASELKCLLVHSLYTRLLVDVNRDITSNSLFRKEGDDKTIDLNNNITKEEELTRIYKYYVSYYTALREVSEKVNPTHIISVHSFNPVYEGEVRKLEIGVLVTDSVKLGEKVQEQLSGKGYNAKLNDPWPADLGNAMNCFARASYPIRREAVCLEFRNDLIQNRAQAPQIKKDVESVLKDLCCLKSGRPEKERLEKERLDLLVAEPVCAKVSS